MLYYNLECNESNIKGILSPRLHRSLHLTVRQRLGLAGLADQLRGLQCIIVSVIMVISVLSALYMIILHYYHHYYYHTYD